MSTVEVKKKETKLSDLIDYKIRVVTHDGRVYIGQLMAFDGHMNLVLGDCVEERMPHKQLKELVRSGGDLSTNVQLEKRTLGLMILRGEHVLSTSVESAPLMSKKDRLQLEKQNNKKLNNMKRARQGSKVKAAPGASNKVTKPAEKGTGRFGSSSSVRPSRFQAPPGFKRRA